jgi:hypothetical protein
VCLQFLVFLPTTASASWTRAADPGKSAATLKRDRETEEKANPETRQRRMEDESFRRMNFFGGHTRATVSAVPETCRNQEHLLVSRRICLPTVIVRKTGCKKKHICFI